MTKPWLPMGERQLLSDRKIAIRELTYFVDEMHCRSHHPYTEQQFNRLVPEKIWRAIHFEVSGLESRILIHLENHLPTYCIAPTQAPAYIKTFMGDCEEATRLKEELDGLLKDLNDPNLFWGQNRRQKLLTRSEELQREVSEREEELLSRFEILSLSSRENRQFLCLRGFEKTRNEKLNRADGTRINRNVEMQNRCPVPAFMRDGKVHSIEWRDDNWMKKRPNSNTIKVRLQIRWLQREVGETMLPVNDFERKLRHKGMPPPYSEDEKRHRDWCIENGHPVE